MILVALFTVKRSRPSHDWVGQMTGDSIVVVDKIYDLIREGGLC